MKSHSQALAFCHILLHINKYCIQFLNYSGKLQVTTIVSKLVPNLI